MDPHHIEDLAQRRQHALGGPGDQAAATKLREQGKLSARARLEILLDPGSFEEIGLHARSSQAALRERTPGDGIVVGHGKIDGRIVYVAVDDASVMAGTRGRVGELKISRVRAAALEHGRPFIALMEAGAARVQESFGATAAGMGTRFGDHFKLSGRVPQVAAIMGPAFGGPSFTACQSDFTSIVRGTGFMGMSGPLVVKVGIGESVTAEEIGGAQMSAVVTGQADHIGDSEEQTLLAIRAFLSYLPASCDELPPLAPARAAPVDTPEGAARLRALIPDSRRQAYDMRRVLALLVDGGETFEYRARYGANLLTAFARMNGQPIGYVASNPAIRGGVLDQKSARKARKFIDLCDAFHLPLVFIVDAPGFLVGPEIEKDGMVSLASRLLNSVYGASVPKTTIVARKAIGLAYLALGGRAMHPDTLVAWPGAHFDVMGPEAVIELMHGREISRADDPAARRAELAARIEAQSSAYEAAALGLIDDVIDPAQTRRVILQTLEKTASARRAGWKHRVDP